MTMTLAASCTAPLPTLAHRTGEPARRGVGIKGVQLIRTSQLISFVDHAREKSHLLNIRCVGFIPGIAHQSTFSPEGEIYKGSHSLSRNLKEECKKRQNLIRNTPVYASFRIVMYFTFVSGVVHKRRGYFFRHFEPLLPYSSQKVHQV